MGSSLIRVLCFQCFRYGWLQLPARSERRWALWLFLLGGLVSAKSTGFNFTHYYALIAPPAALFAGQGLDHLLRRPRLARVLFIPATALSLTLLVVVLPVFAIREHRPYSALVAELDRRPGELYVLGDHAEIYAYADRQPERRFFFSVPLVFREDWGASTRADLLACPPELLVLPSSDSDQFQVDWAAEVADTYRTRLEFDNASLLTDPAHVCMSGNMTSFFP